MVEIMVIFEVCVLIDVSTACCGCVWLEKDLITTDGSRIFHSKPRTMWNRYSSLQLASLPISAIRWGIDPEYNRRRLYDMKSYHFWLSYTQTKPSPYCIVCPRMSFWVDRPQSWWSCKGQHRTYAWCSDGKPQSITSLSHFGIALSVLESYN